jgi:hypothetical protein
MAFALQRFEKPIEAAAFYREAAKLTQKFSPLSAVACLQRAISCFIQQRDYASASFMCDALIVLAASASDPAVVEEIETEERGETSWAGSALPITSAASQAIIEARVTLFLLYLLQRQYTEAKKTLDRLSGGKAALLSDLLNSLLVSTKTNPRCTNSQISTLQRRKMENFYIAWHRSFA